MPLLDDKIAPGGKRLRSADVFRVLGRHVRVVVQVPPRAQLTIDEHDIALHFRERFVVADDFLRLNPVKHLVIAFEKELFLSLTIIVLRYHIGGHRNRRAFFDPVEAEFKRIFVSPVDGRHDADSLGRKISAAPAVPKRIVKLQERAPSRRTC